MLSLIQYTIPAMQKELIPYSADIWQADLAKWPKMAAIKYWCNCNLWLCCLNTWHARTQYLAVLIRMETIEGGKLCSNLLYFQRSNLGEKLNCAWESSDSSRMLWHWCAELHYFSFIEREEIPKCMYMWRTSPFYTNTMIYLSACTSVASHA